MQQQKWTSPEFQPRDFQLLQQLFSGAGCTLLPGLSPGSHKELVRELFVNKAYTVLEKYLFRKSTTYQFGISVLTSRYSNTERRSSAHMVSMLTEEKSIRHTEVTFEGYACLHFDTIACKK